MNLEELKSELAKQEKALANPKLVALMGDKIQAKVDTLKKQISEMESKAENKVEDAQQKVEDAQQKVDDATTTKEKKEAQQEVKEAKKEEQEAKKEVKEVQQTSKQVEQVEKKVEKKIGHGGYREKAGRKKGSKNKKASSPTKMKKPDGVRVRPMPKRRRKKIVRVKKERKMPVRKMPVRKAVKKEEMKTVRAFGKSIQYKNNAEFCKKLINAFKKRKVASRSKKRKTKPVFGVITQGVKNAVSKALHNVPKKQIEKNPKEFLAKAQRLEKSAIKFLEDFKSILGSDYKKSEITSEFGELEKTIKSFVSKYTKK